MNSESLYNRVIKNVDEYLEHNHNQGLIIDRIYQKAKEDIGANLKKWLDDETINSYAPNFKAGLINAVEEDRWDHICEAFYTDITFGTGGIRGVAAFTEKEFEIFKESGINSPVLCGPNTINSVVLLLKTAGVAQWAADKQLDKVVIGYDSRMNGRHFAELVAKTFLGADLTVFFFDEACPYPELTFAIPTVHADFGILISASHNDKRYNGYKLSSKTGAQFDPAERNEIFENYIIHADLTKIKLKSFDQARKEQLVFLGGSARLEGVNYYGSELRDIHSEHIAHVKKFLKFDQNWLEKNAPILNIGYTAYYGVGFKAVPRLLEELGFKEPIQTTEMNIMDGSFPKFDLEQQPDPGDQIAAEIAVGEFKRELSESNTGDTFENLDIVIGTDPDADRTGLIVKVPQVQEEFVRLLADTPIRDQLNLPSRDDFSWMLIDADNAWTILLWFRLMMDQDRGIDNRPGFIVLSHITTDALPALARKFGLGVVKTWVGFGIISNTVRKVWEGEDIAPKPNDNMIHSLYDMENRSVNLGGLEQSNGFSILGTKPGEDEVFHHDGHTRDKDGTFASVLLAELAAYAKLNGTSIFQLIDEKIYLDPDIGLYVTYYEPSPYWGQFEGLTGFSRKIKLLDKSMQLYEDFKKQGHLNIAGFNVVDADFYATGKYDELHGYPKDSYEFPDEGIRFYLDESRLNYLTIRPSGTSQCLRYHIQLKAEDVSRENLLAKKMETYRQAQAVVQEARRIVEG